MHKQGVLRQSQIQPCTSAHMPWGRRKLVIAGVTRNEKQANTDQSAAPDHVASPSGKKQQFREDYVKASRTVYDFPNWEKHRSRYRLVERLLQIPQSFIYRNIGFSLLWCGSIAAIVTLYNLAYEANLLPSVFPSINPSAACSAFIKDTSVALSLLLVFRTNASYGRWDEARKMWGGLLNRSRDLMRQGCTLMADEERDAKKALARWIIAFTRSLRIHFQPEVTLQQELESVLTPAELKMLLDSPHRPVKAIHVLSQVIQNSNLNPIDQTQMSGNLTFYQDVLGGCERLLRAPIPLSYTRHTARFLFMWLTLLPVALYSSCHLWTVPVTLGVALVLCGIEEIGVQCEEPFGILPLDVICNRIQADVMQTLNEDDETKAVLRESTKKAPKMASAEVKPAAAKVPVSASVR